MSLLVTVTDTHIRFFRYRGVTVPFALRDSDFLSFLVKSCQTTATIQHHGVNSSGIGRLGRLL